MSEWWIEGCTGPQVNAIRKFCEENDAKVTGFLLLEDSKIFVIYEVPVAPAQESLTAVHLPEWAQATYGPLGSELSFASSWNERRKARHKGQAIATGSLQIEQLGQLVTEENVQYMQFR